MIYMTACAGIANFEVSMNQSSPETYDYCAILRLMRINCTISQSKKPTDKLLANIH